LHPQGSAAEAVDGLAVEVLGGYAVADQRPRAGLDTQRPVGPADAGDAGEPLDGVGRALWYSAAHRRLDELDERPGGELYRGRVFARRLRCAQRLLMAAQAVVQHRGRPPDEAERSALTPALRVVGGGLDQLSGLRFPAAVGSQGYGAVRRDAAPGRLGYRLGLRRHRGGLGELP